MSAAVLKSAWRADWTRFRRSTSLWLLLLSAPIASRYMISETEGEGINLAVGGQLPVLTSPVFGIWLGIVVSMLVMPVAFIYLRAGPTRRQPWHVDEPTAASRVPIALGRFLADSCIMVGILAVLSIAGLFLAWLKVSGPWQPGVILVIAWIVALPTLLATAAMRILFDAVPALRGAFGDFVFFMVWMVALVIPSIFAESPSTYWANLASLSGAIRPLVDSAPPGSTSFAIGTSSLQPGRIELDPWRGILADGYIAARLSWIVLAFAIAAFAGLVYRPHKPKNRRNWLGFLDNLSLSTFLPKRAAAAVRPNTSSLAIPALVLTELRLIAAQSLFLPLAAVVAIVGATADFRDIGSPAALLLMVFALSAHAGQSENASLRGLMQIATFQGVSRRAAFVIAGTALTGLLALPAAVATASTLPLVIGLATGAAASSLAIALATISGSSFMPRVVMLIVWYAYFAG